MPSRFSYKNDSDEDQRASPEQTARDLQQQEQQSGYDRDFNDMTSPEKLAKSGKSGDLVKNAEEKGNAEPVSPWQSTYAGYKTKVGRKLTKSNFFKITKKRGIIGAITTVVLGGGIAGITLLSPAGVFMQLGNVFTNAFDDSAPALSIRANRALRMKVDGLKNAFEQSDEGKCNIKCKMGTIDAPMKRNLESPSNGFEATFSEKKFGGRYAITSITFPDGTITRTGAEFDRAMQDPGRARDFKKVFNSRIKFFLNGSKFAQMLRTKTGLDRLTKASGDTKKKVVASMRKGLGLSGASATADNGASIKTKTAAIQSKISVKAGKSVSDIAALVCSAYDIAKVSVAATKTAKIAAFGAFALTFLAVKDEIMRGDADPNTVSVLGAQITEGSSLSESQIYNQAANGDVNKSDSEFSLSPSGDLVSSLAFATSLVGVNAGTRIAARTVCNLGSAASIAAVCGPAFVAGLPAAGVGAIATAASCVAVNASAGAIFSGIATIFVPMLIDTIIKSDLKIPDETTVGKDAVQVIGLGANTILNGKSQAYGMTAATKPEDISSYNAATYEYNEQEKAIAKLDAADNPLDGNNQYTFVGSLTRKLNLLSFQGSSFANIAKQTLAVVPNSLKSLTPVTSAASTYPLGYDKSKIYKSGNNSSLDTLGIISDSNGTETYVMSSEELNADIYTTIDKLIASGDIDEDGNAIAGSDYEKYQKYCGMGRVDPLGESSGSIYDNDYEWSIGQECVSDSEHMKNIRVFTMDMAINDTFDEKPEEAVSDDTTVSDQAVLPVPEGYGISSGFGPRGTGTHPAIDFSNYAGGSLGKPVYAIMDGEVIDANKDGGNNPVSIKHANGTVSQYLHMFAKDITAKTGDKVKAGDQIGKIGESGEATGAHLDLRIYIDGVDLDKYPDIKKITETSTNVIVYGGPTYINPIPYMKLYGVDIK